MISVVIGLGYGDEGKGMVTDYLCSLTPPSETIVCRFSGGHQAGHTVQTRDIRHVFSNFGSGTLRGVDTYWSSACTVDPVGIMNEYNKLKDVVKKFPTLYINRKCPVVTPYDKAHGIYIDRVNNHGTCGVGHGATRKREQNNYKLNVFDIMYPEIFKEKVNQIRERYPWSGADMEQFYNAIEFMRSNIHIHFVDKMPKRYHEVYEGSQGLMLDKDIGFFPYVTHSNVGHQNLVNDCEDTNFYDYSNSNPVHFYFVTRSYSTRHGNGPFTGDEHLLNLKKDIIETNVNNPYQGEFKKGPLHLETLQYAVNKLDNIDNFDSDYFVCNLVVTCMDHIEEGYNYPLFVNGEYKFLTKQKFLRTLYKAFKVKINRVYINSSPIGKLSPCYLER